MRVKKTAYTLVDKAISSGDVYSAAAVYGISDGRRRKLLENMVFSKRKELLRLASWEHTPTEVLQLLSDSEDAFVTLRLCKNPKTPSQALTDLYVKSFKGISKGINLTTPIAKHQHAVTNLLAIITHVNEDLETLKAISQNPSANGQLLMELLSYQPQDEKYKVFDKNIASNPSASSEALKVIYDRGDAYARAAVIAHANCPPLLLSDAESDSNVLVQRKVARKCVKLEVLANLVENKDTAVRCGVASNELSPQSLIKTLMDDSSFEVRRMLAKRCDLQVADIDRLMNDEDSWVRLWIARNKITPLRVLKVLSYDTCHEVRRAVASNPRCPVFLLETLAKDNNAWVRSAVAYQEKSPMRILVELAKESDIDVLSGVANNKHTPQNILEELVQSSEPDIRRGVILNRNARRTTLMPSLEDPYYLHRLMLVNNPMLNAMDKVQLCEDPDFNVRFAAYSWFAGLEKSTKTWV